MRIELFAGALDEGLSCHKLRACLAVALLGRHGDIGVGDRNNSGCLGDFCSSEPFRIACAVIPFMTAIGRLTEIRIFRDAGKNLPADHRLLPDGIIINLARIGAVLDDAVRNADHADIVQQSRVIDLLRFLIAFVAELCDPPGIFCDSDGIALDEFILFFNGGDKSGCRLVEEPLQVRLLILQIPDLAFMQMLHGTVDVNISGDIQTDGNRDQRHIDDGDAVPEDL